MNFRIIILKISEALSEIVRFNRFIAERIYRLLSLPVFFIANTNANECNKNKINIFMDFLYIFFILKSYPTHYFPCKLWQVERSQWKYYYGSGYDPYQRKKLRASVWPDTYRILFNNKELSRLLFEGIGIRTPPFFGIVDPEIDYQRKILEIFSKHKLNRAIIKPVCGSAGEAICLIERHNKDVRITQSNQKSLMLRDLKIKSRSLIQGYVNQHCLLSDISSQSVNTIRIVTLYTKKNKTLIIGAYLRTGIGKSFLDNISEGGIGIGIDLSTGKLYSQGYNKLGQNFFYHPTSKICFDSVVVPFWSSILKLAKDTQKTFSFYPMLGLDIAIDNNGPVLIEANSEPDLVGLERSNGPLLKDIIIFQSFKKLGLLYNHKQQSI